MRDLGFHEFLLNLGFSQPKETDRPGLLIQVMAENMHRVPDAGHWRGVREGAGLLVVQGRVPRHWVDEDTIRAVWDRYERWRERMKRFRIQFSNAIYKEALAGRDQGKEH